MTEEELREKLDALRESIDGIDAQLLDLLNQRAQCSVEVGKLKRDATRAPYVPERERQILSLRFDRGWTAVQIAEEMSLESPRRAYTIIDRGLRMLRNLLKSEEKRA